jgi:hypothetical protein
MEHQYSYSAKLRVPQNSQFENISASKCIACIRSHITVRIQDRRIEGINCINAYCNDPWTGQELSTKQEWRKYAPHFLLSDQQQAFTQQSIDAFMMTTETWMCPNGCTSPQWTLDPKHTPRFPHVECPGCTGRFCACCKVGWHEGMTCQEYMTAHPELRDEEEVAHLEAMAQLGARRCPCCCWIIVKDGGCAHMLCERCLHDFDWRRAEKVRPPVESVASRKEADPSQPNVAELWDKILALYELHSQAVKDRDRATVHRLTFRLDEAREVHWERQQAQEEAD